MAIISATKKFTFCMAHCLAGHKGKCRFIHGHNYTLYVTIAQNIKDSSKRFESGTTGSSEGMVVDFSDLKEIVKRVIIDKYDHSLMVQDYKCDVPGFGEYLKSIRSQFDGNNIHIVDYRPTAENMCVVFANMLKSEFGSGEFGHRYLGHQYLRKIRLYETDDSYAEYEFDFDSRVQFDSMYE